jgi:hypothetical protein
MGSIEGNPVDLGAAEVGGSGVSPAPLGLFPTFLLILN